MKQSTFWEANRFSASQEIARILWNPKVHYRIRTFIPYSERQLHRQRPHDTSSRSILILSSNLRLGFPSGLFPSVFPHQNPVSTSPLPRPYYIPRPSHSSRFDHPNNIWWAVQIIKLHSPVTSSLLGPNIFLKTQFSNSFSLLNYYTNHCTYIKFIKFTH